MFNAGQIYSTKFPLTLGTQEYVMLLSRATISRKHSKNALWNVLYWYTNSDGTILEIAEYAFSEITLENQWNFKFEAT